MIFIAGISIALLLSALLFVKKDKSQSDTILFWWMILNAIHLTSFYLLHIGTLYEFPFLLGLQFPLPLLHGVMLYFYVSSVTNKLPNAKFLKLLHFLPAIVTLVYLTPFFLLPSETKIEIFKSGGKGYEVFQTILLYAVFLSGITYVIWSTIILTNHKKNIRAKFSNLEDINLKWLQFLTYGLGLIWTLVIFNQNDNLIFIGVSIFVILIGFFGLQQRSIFGIVDSVDISLVNTPANEVKTIPIPEKEKKYSSSGLSEEKEDQYRIHLTRLISEEKVFKNADLSLSDLASMLDIHPNYLSQIINKKEEKSFYDYINSYRVEEFKRLVSIPKNKQFTLMSLAYDCGFNSKSSFNRQFKKITGQTPTQYSKGLTDQKQ